MPRVPADATRIELDATTLAMLLDIEYVRRPVAWVPPASLPAR